MAITKPMLPPKKGYVEVEINGIRTYRNVETGILIDDEPAEPEITEVEQLRADVDFIAIMSGIEL